MLKIKINKGTLDYIIKYAGIKYVGIYIALLPYKDKLVTIEELADATKYSYTNIFNKITILKNKRMIIKKRRQTGNIYEFPLENKKFEDTKYYEIEEDIIKNIGDVELLGIYCKLLSMKKTNEQEIVTSCKEISHQCDLSTESIRSQLKKLEIKEKLITINHGKLGTLTIAFPKEKH